jgi:hypothetical protein
VAGVRVHAGPVLGQLPASGFQLATNTSQFEARRQADGATKELEPPTGDRELEPVEWKLETENWIL